MLQVMFKIQTAVLLKVVQGDCTTSVSIFGKTSVNPVYDYSQLPERIPLNIVFSLALTDVHRNTLMFTSLRVKSLEKMKCKNVMNIN